MAPAPDRKLLARLQEVFAAHERVQVEAEGDRIYISLSFATPATKYRKAATATAGTWGFARENKLAAVTAEAVESFLQEAARRLRSELPKYTEEARRHGEELLALLEAGFLPPLESP